MSSGDPYSSIACQKILEEFAPLLSLYRSSQDVLDRLQTLITDHFQDDDFRSYCCYGVAGRQVPLQLFNELCILPATEYNVQLSEDGPSGALAPSKLLPDEKEKYLDDFASTACKNILSIFTEIVNFHPRKVEILGYIPEEGLPLTWSLQILGSILGSIGNMNLASPPRLPSLPILRKRIQLSIDMTFDAKVADKKLRFFSKVTGAMWQNSIDDAFDAKAIYLQAGSEFKNLLANLLLSTGSTFDVLAGVKTNKRYPEVEEVVRTGFKEAKLKGIHSLDLQLEDGTLGGTVIAMHNEGFLSVEWIAAYLVDTDQNHFMVDERAQKKNNKQRCLRIFSAVHDFENPTWMQFGKKKGVYLYLSQRASAAEEGWLTIVSYIVNLLIDDINKRLDNETGRRYRLEQVIFDAGVASLADPSLGSYARHQDGFPGLIDPLVKGFSRFDLVVPTAAFQNHSAATTKISWYRKGAAGGKPAGFFLHDFFIQHWQLPGVNLNFEHDVSEETSLWQSLQFLPLH